MSVILPIEVPVELTLFLAHGLWGQAKFQNVDSAPFAALVSR